MIYIIKNKHLAHVVIAAGDEILLSTDAHTLSADKLIKASDAVNVSPALGKKFDAISYSKPYTVLAYADDEKLEPVKKSKPKPTAPKKAATKK